MSAFKKLKRSNKRSEICAMMIIHLGLSNKNAWLVQCRWHFWNVPKNARLKKGCIPVRVGRQYAAEGVPKILKGNNSIDLWLVP